MDDEKIQELINQFDTGIKKNVYVYKNLGFRKKKEI